MRIPHAVGSLVALALLTSTTVAVAAPTSFSARAQGRQTGDTARISVTAWSSSGRPLRGVRVEVRPSSGRAIRRCGTTNRRGRATCRIRVGSRRPTVYASRGSLRRVPIRFSRYVD